LRARLRRALTGPTGADMTIHPARPDELAAAFALLYGPAADGHVAHAFQLVARGELNPDDLLVARTGDTLAGAVFCQRLPGAVAVIWPPGAIGKDRAVEDALTSAALEHVANVKVVQSFLPPEEAARAEPLLRAGFRRVTRVWQMERPSSPPLPRKAGGEGRKTAASALALLDYRACDPTEFAHTLLRSHDDSLDCPELHGVRTPEEVLSGYRDCAPDLARWWLARAEDEPVGVLILGPSELSFVGVVPERRGQGIGRALVEAAVSWHAALSVIVDERNTPARTLYRSLGFQTVGSRDVFLLIR
ncbi:MAG: GNAT family N-acetyltransferase, partial [Zavarzinella sp.]|nr:GNAT family N-acetyltransferase [Zavarzinella sp.]